MFYGTTQFFREVLRHRGDLVELERVEPLFTISYREVALFYCPGKFWHVGISGVTGAKN